MTSIESNYSAQSEDVLVVEFFYNKGSLMRTSALFLFPSLSRQNLFPRNLPVYYDRLWS